MKSIPMALAALALSASVALAGPMPGMKKAPAPKKGDVVCPVLHNKVTNTKTAQKSVYKGKTYYFCCAGCKPQFDKNPAKYVKK